MTRKLIFLAVSIGLTAVTAICLAVTYPRPDLSWSYNDILALRDDGSLPFRRAGAIWLTLISALETMALGAVGLRSKLGVVIFVAGLILTVIAGIATIRMGALEFAI